MRVICFSKGLKLDPDFQNVEKIDKSFYFLNSCFWIGWVKLYLLRRKDLSSEVNVLRNSPKILHITKKKFLELNVLHSDQ